MPNLKGWDTVKITRFEIRVIEIPLRFSVQHALAKRDVARNLVVGASDELGNVGWGESCPRSYVTGETIDTAKQALRESILPPLLGRAFSSFEAVADELQSSFRAVEGRSQAAFCGCELAVLDLAGNRFGVSAGRAVGPQRAQQVDYSGVIASEEPSAVERFATLMHEFNLGAVKVKVGTSLETNQKLLSIARRLLGDRVGLRIDANCAWTAQEAIRQLEHLKDFALEGVEQPVPAHDLEAMAAVTAAELTPVVADESLCSVADAETLIRRRGCDVFNIRISKCGGLINAARIHDLGVEAGLRCQLGAQVGETGILSAAGRHYATRRDPVVWLEGSYGEFLLEQDIVEPSVTIGRGGRAPALDGPGLGVAPRMELLQKFTKESTSLS